MTDTTPKRRKIPDRIKLAVALRALGVSESEIDWSHEPALELRAHNDACTDWSPAQHDPGFIFIRKKPEHAHITNKDNGTGRSDKGAIAHARKVRKAKAKHEERMSAKAAKGIAESTSEFVRGVERMIAATPRPYRWAKRPFPKGHRPLQSRNNLRRRT